ncbi:MAG: succinoglycan biosynthesis protein exop, partial [Rhizobiaceae bacterium]|nr:succinoglycan biosynthesis protein exop [Rhizobiaceae bacterium]
RHPELQAVNAQLAGARAQISNELRRITSSMQVELKRAVELEQDLARRLAQLKVRQGDLSGGLVQLRELEREASTKRAVYESYLLRARETGEQRDINTANMSVISTAYPPLDPTGPSRSMIALTGAFLGFASGVGLAMLRGAYESLRDRRRIGQRVPVRPVPPSFPDGGATPSPSGRRTRSGSSTPSVADGQTRSENLHASGARALGGNRADGQSGVMSASYVLTERATQSLGYSKPPKPGAFAHSLKAHVAQASYTVGDESAEIELLRDDSTPPKPHSRLTADNDDRTNAQVQAEPISSQAIEDIRASIADFRAAMREFADNRQARRYI